MNVYVETNFVLELVFEQEQHTSCDRILDLCEAGNLRLVVPAYSLAEPHEKLRRRSQSRTKLQDNLKEEFSQLRRTKSYAEQVNRMEIDIASLLLKSNEEENRRFAQIRDRLASCATIVPLTVDVLRNAAGYESRYDLTPQDALVFASVIAHLRQDNSVASRFLNKDKKGFLNPDIVSELKANNCMVIPDFDDGHEFIKTQLHP